MVYNKQNTPENIEEVRKVEEGSVLLEDALRGNFAELINQMD